MNEMMQNGAAIVDFMKAADVGSRILKFSNGQAVFEPKEPATDLFLTEAGEIRLFQSFTDGRRSLLAILGSGELFGLASLGRLSSYGILAVSVGDSRVLAVPAERLRTALPDHSDIACQFVQILAHQLHSVWTEESELFVQDCHDRLIRKLIGFANSPAAQPVPGGVELLMTHAQLAEAIGAARETVTICLMELRRKNLVQTRRNRIIYDPDLLCAACDDAHAVSELALVA